ncbi:MAG: cobalt ECF transporter T component CbiQ [Candidatus Omnitrophota bacterium]|nr:MAG: cobalt ECF transporter T component CbiQ [Candidatus Omnitrophota bacterium]
MARVNNFIERSLVGALSFLKEGIFADEFAARHGFLQSLAPQIKAITTLVFIILVLFAKSIFFIACLYLQCLLLALLSKVRLGFFLKRTWIFMPLFALFIAVPAIFSVFTPGEPLLHFEVIGFTFIITRQGILGAGLFISRVITSVSYATLLSLTTKHFVLLRVLRVFKIPQVFVMVIGMCYRYIYLFMEVIENTYIAIKSRVGVRVRYAQGQHIVAWNIAQLWQRSYQLNEDVYKAMLSRGYSGEPVILNDFKTNKRDWFWLCYTLTLAIVAFYFTYWMR